MFTRWGDFAFRFRRIIPAVIIVLIGVLYLGIGTQLDDRMSQEGWDDPTSDSTRAAQIEQETFGRDASGDVIVLVTSDSADGADLTDPGLMENVSSQLNAIAVGNQDAVAGMTSYFDTGQEQMLSDDGTSAFAAISLHGTEDEVLDNYRVIEDELHQITVDGATVEIGGATAVAGALDSGMGDDIQRAELIGLPVVALLLLVIFGSVVAACMPLVVGILSILGSMGILSVLAGVTQVNTFSQSVVTLLGLGLAIDYGLFMVSRFREELAEGNDTRTAVRNTTASAGKTVVFSALMVAVALSSLLMFPQAFLKSVAYGAISAVGLAALISVAVLPSLFAMLGHRIDKWTIIRRGRTREATVASWWGKVPAFAMKHAKLMTVGIVALLILLTIPLSGVKFGGINETYLPPGNDTRIAQSHFDDNFPEFRTDPVKLVVEGDNAAVGEVFQKANAIEGLTGTFQVSQPTQDGVTVLSAGIADRDDNDRIVNELRDIAHGLNADGTVLVAGTPAMEVESIEALFDKLPWMLVYIIAATFILLSLVFGSVILPAKAVIMNILGTGATLGILTALFVDGVGADLFNFSPGPLMSPVLVLIVAIIYGLSTDYEVFLVSRMVEARAHGASTPQAIRFGTATTGGIITAAALIMIVVAGAFAFSDIVMMKYIAFGMIAALIIDATVIRMLLVPAVMFLLREDCWWAPRWVTALSRKIGHNEQLEGYSPEQATGPTSGPTSEPVREPVTVGAPEETQDEAQDAAPDARGAVVSRSPLPAARPAGVETQDATDAADASDAEEHDEAASYGAHATSDDAVPFSELMRRLQQERPDDREN
ncbi:MAG: MMPL family transporter [Corynebacterium sp.]|uniref:MMPL family transporter n=1 Tax=Corynebacterium sp. TaxID=1720 RepID=UPI00264A0929|nr:MMPL family transporter [Corynebacterium sp.]MDN5718534.1 MMPL family transporter [Corynebacterium sp.]MDN6509751.1 MMPL family transporter [Corynebacterium sp.]